MATLQIHQIFTFLVVTLFIGMSAAQAQHRSPAKLVMEQFALAYARANNAAGHQQQITLAALNESGRTTWKGSCFQLYSQLPLVDLLKQLNNLPSPIFAAQRPHYLVITPKQGQLSPQETFPMGYEISFFNGEYLSQQQLQTQTSSIFTITKANLKVVMDLRPYPAVAITSRQPRELLIFNDRNGGMVVWQWRELVDFTNEVCRFENF